MAVAYDGGGGRKPKSKPVWVGPQRPPPGTMPRSTWTVQPLTRGESHSDMNRAEKAMRLRAAYPQAVPNYNYPGTGGQYGYKPYYAYPRTGGGGGGGGGANKATPPRWLQDLITWRI